jgi:hypothetical protein
MSISQAIAISCVVMIASFVTALRSPRWRWKQAWHPVRVAALLFITVSYGAIPWLLILEQQVRGRCDGLFAVPVAALAGFTTLWWNRRGRPMV